MKHALRNRTSTALKTSLSLWDGQTRGTSGWGGCLSLTSTFVRDANSFSLPGVADAPQGLKGRAITLVFAVLVCAFISSSTIAQESSNAKDKRNPSVGAAGFVSQIVLPGSELSAKPLADGSPIVMRITKVFPHGDSFRYDIRFHGLEPGKFNLADWLERKDGSATDDLPNIEVDIQSLLPSGQIEPNDLETGILPRLGGYRNVAIAVAGLWLVGLLGLIFLGRRKAAEAVKPEKKASLAELLKARIEAAMENRMDSSQYAELERMLFGYWRKRLGLESVSANDALATIKQDEKAGPLMNQLEQWMHNPSAPRDVDLGELVAPFRDLPADLPEFAHVSNASKKSESSS